MPELNEEAKKSIANLEEENQKLEKEVGPLYTAIGKNYYEKPEEYEQEMEKAVGRLDAIKKQIHENRIAILAWKGIRLCPNCGSEVEQGAIFCGECGIRMEAVKDVDENSILCSRCGAKNEKGKKFCVICGQKLVDIIKATEGDLAQNSANSNVMTVTTGFSCSESETGFTDGVATSTVTTGFSCSETTSKEEETTGMGQIEAEAAATTEEGSSEDTAAEFATASEPANGTELPPEDVIFCPECGNKLPSDALFCAECGTRIEMNQEASTPVSDAPLFCTECGTKLVPGSAFCTECGTPVQTGK